LAEGLPNERGLVMLDSSGNFSQSATAGTLSGLFVNQTTTGTYSVGANGRGAVTKFTITTAGTGAPLASFVLLLCFLLSRLISRRTPSWRTLASFVLIAPILTAVHRPRLQGVHPHHGDDHVRTSPGYPQSNGKLERWHKSLKSECIRPGTPLTREDAVRLIQTYVDHYNTVRLHSAIGYVTPHDILAGRQAEIHATRDRKLEEARHQRQLRRTARSMLAHSSNTTTMTSPGETEAGSAGMQLC